MKKVFILFIFIFTINIQLSAQDESEWVLRLFNFSADATSISDNTISLSIDAAWLASELTGQTTITGTLTQDAQGNWGYTASPSDKLVVVFNDGSSIEFKFTKIEGYVDGDANDFKESHSMDFTAYSSNYINVRIISNIGPVDSNTEWQNVITGNMIVNGNNHTVNITHEGWKYSEIGNGYAFFKKNELITGTSSSAVSSYQLNDRYYVSIAHNSNVGFYNKDTQFWKNSSLTTGGTTYAFQNVNVFYVGATELYDDANQGLYNKVNESYNWSSEGSLLKNNQQYASIVFSETPIDNTSGPYLLAKLNSGGNIILHYLLNSAPTNVEDKTERIITEYKLEQNYPNPFNPTTKIKYTIATPHRSSLSQAEGLIVTLKVYDILGREVATLVNKQQQPGNYEVEFNASGLPSGVYFYELRSGEFSQIKKMMLLR
ncbi:hypothetical protein MNBD_IGNAVI01-1606 [hydrothermal vent metagenome]|uniref:Secretion system C-terminal sorting domain-containing protein n=1 Tax=hydrothermal vent metagenome TaxID=652676 RepID=A0A3B1BWC6_9ZZZZ